MSTSSKVILWDLMDTVVKDPFFTHMPAFFGLSFDELLRQKHPSHWAEFELGHIDEATMIECFFHDTRPVNGDAFKNMLKEAYAYIDGMEPLLAALKARGVEMHALSNYPPWYALIEERLRLSRYIELSFISCKTGTRKPDPQAYRVPCQRLARRPQELIFVDDREVNVQAAQAEGLIGIHFTGDLPALQTQLDALLG